MMRTPLLALLPLALLGCVPQSKYDDLKRSYDEARAELGDRGDRIAALEQSLAAEQAKLDEQQKKIAEAEAKLAELEQQRASGEQEVTRLSAEEQRLTSELAELLKDRVRLRESSEELKQALAELAKRKAEADRRVAEFRNLLAKFKNMIDAGKLQVKITDGRMVLALPTDVLFDSGSAKLSKEGASAIAEVASVLATIKNRRFQVEGHTDNVPISTPQYPSNWELSADRALGVVKALIAGGMKPGGLSAAGYGEYHPVVSNDKPHLRVQNRRIEIVIVPDLSMLPGFDELKRVVEGS